MATKALGTKPAASRTASPGTRTASKAKTAPAKSKLRIVETAQDARGGEPGPSVLALLTVSTIAAGFVLAIVWFMFFRT